VEEETANMTGVKRGRNVAEGTGSDGFSKRIADLLAKQERRLEQETPKSREMFERAIKTMPKGVGSTYQARDPYPVYYTHGKGSKVYSVDGGEASDFHNGYGCMVQGHAHPAIVEAVKRRVELGTQFALPTEDQFVVAEHLAKNFKLPKWRFTNSGSESTMDAIRIARGLTGRDTIMKIFGSYHGHHDYAMISIGFIQFDERGPRDNYRSIPWGAGIPRTVVDLVYTVPFNDASVLEARIERLEAEGRKPACLIMEPIMFNLGMVPPEPGYLEAVRKITKQHDIVLIFDEVKSGICIAAGGAVERYGVLPDMVCLAKALGAGLPSGAIGGTDEVMAVVNDGTVYQVGTYSGNPLCMAAARASLEEVMTPDAYKHLDYLNDRLCTELTAVAAKHDFPGYTDGMRAKGWFNFATGRVVDYESFMEYQNSSLCALAWLYNINNGVLISPGRAEEWTLSVQHTDEDIDRYVAAFTKLVEDVTA
jgi:glutamate-1-semialdehyde 2,1-aminomutase